MNDSAKEINIGEKAPDFALKDQQGNTVRLSDFKGKKSVVLFFYPKDFTPVCTLESIAFRDSYQDFQSLGAEVIGVSQDGSSSHAEFCSSNNLQFKLLTDPDNQVRDQFGGRALLGRKADRVTWVIGPDGLVQGRYVASLRAKKHVEEALKILKEISE